MIRTLSTKLIKEESDRIISAMRDNGEPESSVNYDLKTMKLSFPASIMKYLSGQSPVTLSYYDTTLSSSASYRNVFKEILLNTKKKIIAERWRAIPDIELNGDEMRIFKERYLDESHSEGSAPDLDKWAKINSMELIHEGLQNYW